MPRETPRISKFLCGLALAGLLPACQNYDFEMVPSSVFSAKRWTQIVSVAQDADILFVVDNSGSMVGEQVQLGQSFETFVTELDEKFGTGKYHIALVTPGMESAGCPVCPKGLAGGSCINDTGENGRFQDRIGCVCDPGGAPECSVPAQCINPAGAGASPKFLHESSGACRVVTSNNLSCFYDPKTYRGTVLVGTSGCGYERGLSAVKKALQPNLLGSYNGNFLRPDATLAVVVVSDEEDCGEVGDVNENLPAGGKICYYASKGTGPTDETSDTKGKPYKLTPVESYFDFLMGVKNKREGMVKFAAIVGVTNTNDLSTTKIEFESRLPTADAKPACTTPSCTSFCAAYPGTRYLKLAEMFGIGKDGFVDTICQGDFSDTMRKLGSFVACPREFKLSEKILDPALANILINDKAVPRFSCNRVGELIPCDGESDRSCPGGANCVETWSYKEPAAIPDPLALGGTITFAAHYDPCNLVQAGQVSIELVYVTE